MTRHDHMTVTVEPTELNLPAQWRYQAYRGDMDLGTTVGYGPTVWAALEDLSQWEEVHADQ